MTLRRWFILIFLSFAPVGLVAFTPLGNIVDTNVVVPIMFEARSWVNGPGLSEQIKILSFDDHTSESVRSFDLSLDDWADLIVFISQRQPKAILFDKIFDKHYSEQEVLDFISRVQNVAAPLFAIGFTSQRKIPGRNALTGTDLVGEAEASPSDQYLYGMSENLRTAFTKIGHAMYSPDGRLPLTVGLVGGELVRHVSLLVDSFSVADDGVYSAGANVLTDHTGRVVVNVDKPEVYYNRTYSLKPVLNRMRKGGTLPIIQTGDVVILLPAMYTGNTDWRKTPHGVVPGGYVIAAMVNSVLTRDWLIDLQEFRYLFVLFGLISGVIIGRMASSTLAFRTLALSAILMPLSGVGVFIQLGILTPWHYVLAPIILTGSVMQSYRININLLDQMRIKGEISAAKSVQSELLPIGVGNGRLKIGSVFYPAEECSGDWWYCYEPYQDLSIVLIGDAIGHGVSAAMISTICYSVVTQSISTSSRQQLIEQPEEILRSLNRVITYNGAHAHTALTMLICVCDFQKMNITFCSAGHTMPLYLGAETNQPRIVPARGPMLGVAPDIMLTKVEQELIPGDRFVIFTDGLVENTNLDRKPWGARRLRKALQSNWDAPVDELPFMIYGEHKIFCQDQVAQDDVTIVCLEVGQ